MIVKFRKFRAARRLRLKEARAGGVVNVVLAAAAAAAAAAVRAFPHWCARKRVREVCPSLPSAMATLLAK